LGALSANKTRQSAALQQSWGHCRSIKPAKSEFLEVLVDKYTYFGGPWVLLPAEGFWEK
jgi:hypothetical protein